MSQAAPRRRRGHLLGLVLAGTGTRCSWRERRRRSSHALPTSTGSGAAGGSGSPARTGQRGGLSPAGAVPRGGSTAGWHKVPHWSPGGQGRSVREQRGPCPGVGRRPSVPAQGDAPPARPRVPRGRFSATSRWRTTARSGPARSAASTTAGRPPGRRGARVQGGRSTGLGAGHRQMPSPLGPVVGDRPGPGRMRGVSRPHGCAAPRLAALGGR